MSRSRQAGFPPTPLLRRVSVRVAHSALHAVDGARCFRADEAVGEVGGDGGAIALAGIAEAAATRFRDGDARAMVVT